MNKKTTLFAVLALAFSPLVGAQNVSGPEMAGTPAPAPAGGFAAVSADEVSGLKALLPTDGLFPAIVGALQNVDAEDPAQRALLAPVKAAKAGGASDVLLSAAQAVKGYRTAAMSSAADPNASLADLDAALARFSELQRLVSLYEPESAAQFDLARFSAEGRAGKMRAAAAKASAEQTAAALSQPKDDASVAAPVKDGRLAVAEAMIKDLRGSLDTDYSEGLVAKLEAAALGETAGEELQRVIAEGLVRDLRDSTDTDYSEYVVDSLERIAKKSSFPSVQKLIVEGVMQDVHHSVDTDYSNYGLSAVENIAVESADHDVKGLALAHMLKEVKDSIDTSYSEDTQARVDRIGLSAGGLVNIPVPELPKPAPPAPKAPKPSVDLGRQLSEGADTHPVGAFFGLLALAASVWSMGIHSFPILAIALAGLLLLGMGVRGLYTDHPVAGFFQLLVVGHLFAAAATFGGPLSAGSWLALAVGGLTGASVADWSFTKDHPVAGFFLNLVLMWMFLAAAIGPHAAMPFLSITAS